MEHGNLISGKELLLSVQMIVDELSARLWNCTPSLQGDVPRFRCCRLFAPEEEPLRSDVLYILDGSLAERFPRDRFSYVTDAELSGAAPHIRGLHRPMGEIVNLVLRIFDEYRAFEMAVHQVFISGGSLTELCRTAERFFHNPIFIHDRLFALIGLPKDVETSGQFEYNAGSGIYHIPLSMIDEFKFDGQYLQTFRKRGASLWVNAERPNRFRSMYVNLWSGTEYYGRLLVNERESPLQPGQFRAAEFLAGYACLIIHRDLMRVNRSFHSFEDTLTDMALGRDTDPRERSALLSILGWKSGERYLVLRLRSKDEALAVSPVSALRTVLPEMLISYVSFFYEQQLCIVVNLTLSGLNPALVQQRLAPQIRDNYLIGGVSNPFLGLQLLPAAFCQAGAALDAAADLRADRWLVAFSTCALEYICDRAVDSLPPQLLAAPQLLKLKTYDGEHGTEYYRTLRAWLTNERNIPATSEHLILHRTTLTYRLKKLQEILLMDLDDPQVRLYLLLSYYLLEHLPPEESGA